MFEKFIQPLPSEPVQRSMTRFYGANKGLVGFGHTSVVKMYSGVPVYITLLQVPLDLVVNQPVDSKVLKEMGESFLVCSVVGIEAAESLLAYILES